MDENNRVLCYLQFSRKCIQLLEKYRKLFTDFRSDCVCVQTNEKESQLQSLEQSFEALLQEEIDLLNASHQKVSDIKPEVIEIHEIGVNESVDNEDTTRLIESNNDSKRDSNEDLSEEWVNYESDDNDINEDLTEDFVPKKRNSKKRSPKSDTNITKNKKKYVYYNYVCDWIGCDRKYSKKDDLMAHISSCHTNEKPFKCEVCSKSFSIEKFLKSHQKVHSINTKIDLQKSFVCDINNCGKPFNSPGNLKKHQSTVHSDLRPYVCEWPGCNAAYKIKESLINHRAIHSDKRQFSCVVDGCEKTFQTKWNYYSHMKAHRSQANPEKAKRFPCDWPGCQYKGNNKQDLTIHTNRHMNIKPYKCQAVDCQMSYFTSYELKQHTIKVHEVVNESDREFKCHYDGCQKRYAVERDLKRHLRRHDRIYACSWPECGQRYAAKQLLLDHMDRHMNQKSFHCHFIGCAKSFFSKTNYESHMKKIHKYHVNKHNIK